MNKTIIVSNRLPLDLNITDNKLSIRYSVGGLATGLKSVHRDGNGIWVGWSGLAQEALSTQLHDEVEEVLKAERCAEVPLTDDDIENFYIGFSNNALWPLFHYFQEYASFELSQWESYKQVNRKFADAVLQHAKDGDTVWVHDYQLLLLPGMLRESGLDIMIGFFLHIPYPSNEIFRTFPWREELLKGILGADLIGFHTFDYVRHFLSSVKRVSGLEVKFNEILYNGRSIKVDSFPMGIDYSRFNNAALEHARRPQAEKSELMLKLEEHGNSYSDARLILSIDRMDYTKGIPNRIRAFEYFLDKYPAFREKVRLVMLSVPSRESVPQYQKLKKETDELVGRVNGRFATVNWTPIWYFYRSMPFDDLVDLYTAADIAMITPLRDGMNLVAKEYVAARAKGDGVLILSEMAGAAKELDDALLVNPYNFEQIADTLCRALEMSTAEQSKRMNTLQHRVARYTVEKWADDFLKSLIDARQSPTVSTCTAITSTVMEEISARFQNAQRRLLLLDYDGTLRGFTDAPSEATPDEQLIDLLDSLALDNKTDVAIISGRDRASIEEWFGNKPYTLATDHGVWLRPNGESWDAVEILRDTWKASVRPVLEAFVDRTPGSFIEEKDYSLAWHYRKADAELADLRAMELRIVLDSLLANNVLTVLEGNKVIEVKSSNINKGRASLKLANLKSYDFILAMGDDWTDEHMFEELPLDTVTVKVGRQNTCASYFVEDVPGALRLLSTLVGPHAGMRS